MGYKKITLDGNQICDYLYVTKSQVDQSQFQYINMEPKEWKSDTVMLSKFNDKDMSAGNSSLTNNIVGYEIRRKSGDDLYTEYVGTVPETSDGSKKYIIDYAVKNNTDYIYYLYPNATHSGNGVALHPSITNEVKTDWGYWSLLVVDESEEENVFYLSKMFKFELNIAVDAMSNNAVISILQNFTKYPTVQYGTANYWSGSLSALSGYISCVNGNYMQTPDMIEELKSLTSDTRRKFLKDVDGNIWEVKITAPISITTEALTPQSLMTAKISWAEVGKTSGVSIINNPNAATTSWILTETGEVKPYIDYVWDEDSHWNSSYKWTAKEDMLETKESNLGREIYKKEGGAAND